MSKLIRQLLRTVQRPPIQVVKAIIVNEEGKVLILRRSRVISLRRMNDLPGGVVDRGEDLETALRREVFEETGLKIDECQKISSSRSLSMIGPIHMHVYAAKAAGAVKLSWEHDRSWWAYPVDVLQHRSLPKPYRAALKRFVKE